MDFNYNCAFQMTGCNKSYFLFLYIMYSIFLGFGGLYHHCGVENESKNNYVHRVGSPANGQNPLKYLVGACEANQGRVFS